MKTIHTLVTLFIVSLLMVSCDNKDGSEPADNPNPGMGQEQAFDYYGHTGYGEYSESYTLADTHVYYVRSTGGSNANTGTSYAAAFETLARAREAAISGDTIYLDGSFEGYSETNPDNRTDWITYLSYDPDNPAVINGLYVNNTSERDTYLRFDSIDFVLNNDGNITESAIPYSIIVEFYNANHVEIRNCEIHEYRDIKYHTDKAVRLEGKNVLVHGCHIHHAQSGIWSIAENCTIAKNYLHDAAGGPFITLYGTNWIAEDNHLHGSTWDAEDLCHIHTGIVYDYGVNGATEAYDGMTVGCAYIRDYTEPDLNPHNSGIAVWAGSGVIRRNIVHDCGNTAGIRLYPNYVDVYNDIVIENNLVYDAHSSYTPVSLMEVGENILVRNNTIIGCLRTGDIWYARNNMYGTMSTTLGLDADGSGVYIYNNIFLGVRTGHYDTMDCRNNIFWSIQNSAGDYLSALENNVVVCPATALAADFDTLIQYFTDHFFTGIDNAETDLVYNHQMMLDFTLDPASPAIDYGDSSLQPDTSLGTLENGYIQDNGIARSDQDHSAGCYEQ